MKKLLVVLLVVSAVNLFAMGALVVNSISQTLSDINVDDGVVDNTFAILGQAQSAAPNKMAFYHNHIFVVITYENAIQKIDAIGGESSYIYLESGSLPNDICIDEESGFAYVTGNGTNKVYQINLTNAEVVSSIEVGTAPQGMAISLGKLYVANSEFNISDYSYDDGTVSVIDLSDFTNIQTLNTVHKNPILIKVIDDRVFAICMGDWSGAPNGGVDIFSNEEDIPANTIDLTGGHPSAAVALLGYDVRALYVGSSVPSGVWTIDPDNYVVISHISESWFEGGASLDASGTTLVTIDPLDWQSNSIVRAYDVLNGVLIGTWNTAVGATDIKIYTDLMENDNDMVQAINSLVGKAYPNPFYQTAKCNISIDFYSKNAGILISEVYNIKGQKISTFTTTTKKGYNTIYWDSKDKLGKNVPSGVYYFKLLYNAQSAIRKVTVIK